MRSAESAAADVTGPSGPPIRRRRQPKTPNHGTETKAGGRRPTILFLHEDAARVDFRLHRHHWLAAQVGFRVFAADWPTLTVSGRETILHGGFEVFASGEARSLRNGTRVQPRVILHRTPTWDQAGPLRLELERANSGALVSFHPSWGEMSTKWTSELCFRAGERAGTPVSRPTTYLVQKSEMRERLRDVGSVRPLIFKPSSGSRCRGVLMSTPETFEAVVDAVSRSTWDRYVVQDLVEDPVLYRGKRFVLRVFALVTSFEPLRFKLYREGLVKMAALDHDPVAVADAPRVLASMDYRKRLRVPVEDIRISELLPYLRDQGWHVDAFWDQLEAVVGNVFTSLARHPARSPGPELVRRFHVTGMDLLMARRGSSFELLFLETNYVPTLFGRGDEQDEAIQSVHREWLQDLWDLCRAT